MELRKNSQTELVLVFGTEWKKGGDSQTRKRIPSKELNEESYEVSPTDAF
jgi:hypothetical protein